MSDDSAVRLKTFSGKEEDWETWAPQFLARAEAKGYQGIAKGEETPSNNSEVLDPNSSTDKEKIKIRKLNKTGYSELMPLCNNAKLAFLLVKKARTQGLPNGSLHEAWKNLKDQYEPVGIKSVQEVIKKYNECTLGKNNNPEEWIAKKDKIQMRLQIEYGKNDYEDNDLKALIVYDMSP